MSIHRTQMLFFFPSFFLTAPLSIHLWGVQCGLLVHGLYPVDESLENIGHMLERADIQDRKHIRMLVFVRAHQWQSVVQEVTSRRHHALTSSQECGCSPERNTKQETVSSISLYILYIYITLLAFIRIGKSLFLFLWSVLTNEFTGCIKIKPLPASFQSTEASLLPSRHSLPARWMLGSVKWVTRVTRISSRWQGGAITQLSLRWIHNGHHPVPGGNQLFFHVVLERQTCSLSLIYLIFIQKMRTLILSWVLREPNSRNSSTSHTSAAFHNHY